MFRFYYSYDLISELEKELQRDHKMIQLMIDEYDLFLLSKSLFKAVTNELIAEVVIISTSQKKTMKLVNLCKRLIDMDVEIYWKVDKELFVKEDYFAIFDKEYLVCKQQQEDFENPEGLVRSKNDFFNGLTLASKKLTLLDGDILIDIELDRSIVYPGEEVCLKWDVKNAHEVEIEPLEEKVAESGSKGILVENDMKFTLVAKNKGGVQKKSVFVRVLKIKEIAFDAEVFDPVLKEFIAIQPINNESFDYAVYWGQKVKISWNIKMLGKLLESNLGNLPLIGTHEFDIKKQTNFNFIFKSITNEQRKHLTFHCFDNPEIFKKETKTNETKTTKKEHFFKKFLFLVKDIFSKMFKK